jgi:Domain of unknown function (DUF4864)
MGAPVRWMLLAVMTLAGPGAGAAGSDRVSNADARAIREVIQAQLKAIAVDDAVLAFSYASPSIRLQFGNASTFMTMVRHGYPMLIRPTATVFLQPDPVEPGVMQQVHLRDEDGRSWLATYHVQLQPDKKWLINGCVVEPDEDDSLI